MTLTILFQIKSIHYMIMITDFYIPNRAHYIVNENQLMYY